LLQCLGTEWNLELEQGRLTSDQPAQDAKNTACSKAAEQIAAARAGEWKPPEHIAAAERFVCLVYTNFIISVLQRIRSSILAAAGLFVFTMLSFTVYPFQSRSLLGFIMLALLLLILGVVGLIFGQMHRDATLSYITETTPGDLGGEFWVKFATFSAAPILSLLAAQYPEIGSAIFSWLQPALGALK
jgi:hypothetical protein